MSFNWRNFFRVLTLVMTRWPETGLPMTPRRAVALAGFFSLYSTYQIVNRLAFLLDALLFPDWKKTPLKMPVFIVGNPRSGTTLLHRLMAKDETHFFTFRTWEILFPAISQKKALMVLERLDRLSGGRLGRKVQRKEEELFGEFNKIHRIGLFFPEEDDKLLFHHFSFHGLAWFFPFDELKRYHKFDLQLSATEKQTILHFYAQALRRQAFCSGRGQRHLLSKNPASSLKLESLLRSFPDCRVIYMVRNPLEVVPSTINMAHAVWRRTAGVQEGRYPYQEGVYEIVRLFYEHPMKVLDNHPQDRYRYVRYEDLTREPARVVKELYGWLGFPVSSDFEQTLVEAQRRAEHYVSQHAYSLADMDIEEARIVQDLKSVFERFGYHAHI